MEFASTPGVRNWVFPGKSEGAANLIIGRMCHQHSSCTCVWVYSLSPECSWKVQTGHFFAKHSILLPRRDTITWPDTVSPSKRKYCRVERIRPGSLWMLWAVSIWSSQWLHEQQMRLRSCVYSLHVLPSPIWLLPQTVLKQHLAHLDRISLRSSQLYIPERCWNYPLKVRGGDAACSKILEKCKVLGSVSAYYQ